MKIKRVEIQAFKNYINAIDGTFDFTVNDTPADFISLLAPNGFGKSSFYDAVDFCITNNITRFVRDSNIAKMNAAQAKSINQDGEKLHLLRAKDAPANLEAYINVFTTEKEFNRALPKARNGGRDYQYKRDKTEKGMEYFQHIMLSQEAIDAFLRESRPEDRYSKFMEAHLGGDDNFESDRQHIQSMLNEVVARKQMLKNKLADIESRNALNNKDESCLSGINSHIFKLSELGYKLSEVDNAFSENLKHKLVLNVAEYAQGIRKEQSELLEFKKSLGSHLNKFSIYEDSYRNINELTEKINAITSTRKNLLGYTNLLNDQNKLNVKISSSESIINEKVKWFKLLPSYIEECRQSNQLSKKLRNEKDGIQKKRIVYSGSVSKDKEKQKKRAELSSRIDKYKSLITKAPELFSNVDRLNTDLEKNKVLTGKNKLKIEKLDVNIESTNAESLGVTTFGIEKPDLIISSEFINDEISLLVNQYIEKKYILENIDRKLKKSEDGLSHAEKQNQSISELIQLGAKIVSHYQDSKCPLCQYDYKSFEELSAKINSNSSLSGIQEHLLKSINEIQILKKSESEQLETLQSGFNIAKKNKLDSLHVNLKDFATEKARLQSEILKYEVSHKNINHELNKLKELTNYRTSVNFEEFIQEDISKIRLQIRELDEDIDSSKKETSKLLKEIDNHQFQISSLEGNLKLTNQEGLIFDFNKYLKSISVPVNITEGVPSEPVMKLIFTEKMDHEKIVLDALRSELKNNKESIKDIKDRFPSIHESPKDLTEELSSQLKNLNFRISESRKESHGFLQEVRKYKLLNYFESNNWVSLTKSFESEVESFDRQSKEKDRAISKLELVSSQANDVLAYINKINSVQKLTALNSEIDRLIGIEKPLDDDLKKINNFIKSKVSQYFYTDLINTIYSKIDPHPDFKKVKFECDMSEKGKPKLHVYIEDKSGRNIVSPTLSFSSAQINVLSLSIFLAKALNTTDADGRPVDCIFIDDPIQSMDSINVLGIIDLLRNICVNLGKQIIISTHDENFHGLLKNKLPPSLFKSKYLELESFGKVAQHEGQCKDSFS